jgi:hypothetical protein
MMASVRTKKALLRALFVSLLFSFLIFFPLPSADVRAAIKLTPHPFGGRILTAVPCTCSLTIWITVGPPVGGSFMITPATRVYRNYSPVPGKWTLGLADIEPLPCLTKPFCEPVGAGLPIRIMGTS